MSRWSTPRRLFAVLAASASASATLPIQTVSLPGRLLVPRSGHQATLLTDGRVLLTGGSDDRGEAVGPAEVFDPATGVWSRAAANLTPRLGHAASLLHDGRVMVVGGGLSASSCEPVGSAELYDPSSDRWSMAPAIPIAIGRGASAVTLTDGRVLISGGRTGCKEASSSAALFDPAPNTWHKTTSMELPAAFHLATRLEDGRVIVSGGFTTDVPGDFVASIFDPATEEWSRAAEPRPLTGNWCDGYVRTYSSAFDRNALIARATPDECPSLTVLPGDTVLIAGGRSTQTNEEQASVQLTDLATDEWVSSWPMQVPRAGHTATRLKNGIVLIAGGHSGKARIASSELYIPRLPYEAWVQGLPRSYGAYIAAVTNSRNRLLVSYRTLNGAPHLLEWVPRWGDFSTGAHWEGISRVRPLSRIGGPYPPYRTLGPGLPVLDSIRVDEHDHIWAASSTTRTILKLSLEGRVLLRFGRRYVEKPSDLAVDAQGNVFVADAGERRPRVIKFDSGGRFVAATGPRGSSPGSLDLPRSVATDADGNVYVADAGNARIQVFDNNLNPRATYPDVGTPWALCVSKEPPRQFIYSASNPDKAESRRTAEIYKLDLDGTILGKMIGNERGKGTVIPRHIDCREANVAVAVGYIDMKRITFGR